MAAEFECARGSFDYDYDDYDCDYDYDDDDDYDDIGDDDDDYDDVGVAWIHLISWIAASPPAALKNSPLSRTDLRTEQAATLF